MTRHWHPQSRVASAPKNALCSQTVSLLLMQQPLKKAIIGAHSGAQVDRESFTSLFPCLHFAEGCSLLCHQTLPQPCHYHAVKVVSGWGLGVSNGSEVTICGTWYDRGCRSPSQVSSSLTESWRAQDGNLFDNLSPENNTRQRGDCFHHLKIAEMSQVADCFVIKVICRYQL